ncbi:MAG: Nif3-like dinuclear metal center hexameric protein [Bacteroidetes bacterium]|nr:Nif3-like dinuclear metal center hexameric protein [Bacteroidota bacterium]
MTVREITSCLEQWAPLAYAEDFDNVGLLVGDLDQKIERAIVTHDAIEAVIDEAIKEKCTLIICFHPIIFQGLKRITNSTYVERAVAKAIKNDIAIYALHTALDVQLHGVNKGIADALQLSDRNVLVPSKGSLLKLNTYVPHTHLKNVQAALFAAGAGALGNYAECSFSSEGTGTFMPLEGSNAFVGEKGERHAEPETQLQVVVPKHCKSNVVGALQQTHPYETVAYELTVLENTRTDLGMGCIGKLPKPMAEKDFTQNLKDILGTPMFRHSSFLGKDIERVALLGGSGSFAIDAAKHQNADVFITADLKYHDFFKGENKILLIDAGHYESEQFTKKIIMEFLSKNFPNFAFISSKTDTNPVHYF